MERLLRAGTAYQERGWPVFVLKADKTPFGNCASCAPGALGATMAAHQAVCGCLMCHGFYAASRDGERLAEQLAYAAGRGGGTLAARTGGEGLCVVDAEGDDRSGVGMTGVDALEEVPWVWPDTLRSRTGSGGVHLWFQIPGAVVGSRPKVLPNVDIKGSGGYVLLPPAAGRSWMNWSCPVAVVEDGPLREFLLAAKGHGGGGGGGSGVRGNLSLRTAAMIPAGRRYEFVRDLVYALRRRGVGREAVLAEMREHWQRMQQPPACAYELPWSQVEYEVDRVFCRVDPEPPLAQALIDWMKGLA